MIFKCQLPVFSKSAARCLPGQGDSIFPIDISGGGVLHSLLVISTKDGVVLPATQNAMQPAWASAEVIFMQSNERLELAV